MNSSEPFTRNFFPSFVGNPSGSYCINFSRSSFKGFLGRASRSIVGDVFFLFLLITSSIFIE